MIDKSSGIVALEAIRLGPSTTIAELLRSPLAGSLRKQSFGDPPWENYSAGAHRSGQMQFAVSLVFKAGRLWSIDLSLRGEKEPISWDEWSEQKERRRKTKHDALLRKLLGKPTRADKAGVEYAYPWGDVFSSYDPRSASSSIVISYPA